MLAFRAWRTACAAAVNAPDPSRIWSARSFIFVADWANAWLAALADSPLNRSSLPMFPDFVSSSVASRRRSPSPVFHWVLAPSSEESSALLRYDASSCCLGPSIGQSPSELLPGSVHALEAANDGATHALACAAFLTRSAWATSSTWLTFL